MRRNIPGESLSRNAFTQIVKRKELGRRFASDIRRIFPCTVPQTVTAGAKMERKKMKTTIKINLSEKSITYKGKDKEIKHYRGEAFDGHAYDSTCRFWLVKKVTEKN